MCYTISMMNLVEDVEVIRKIYDGDERGIVKRYGRILTLLLVLGIAMAVSGCSVGEDC